MEKVQGHLDSGQEIHDQLAVDTALSTLIVILVYIVVKVSVDGIRQWRARVSILVVGAGPVGLTAALVAVRSRKVLNLTILDERTRTALLCRPQQIALDPRSVTFLLTLGVDFDNIEGCWDNDHFFTKIGVFQEHLLSILEQRKQTLDIRILLGTKVSVWHNYIYVKLSVSQYYFYFIYYRYLHSVNLHSTLNIIYIHISPCP